MKTIILLILFCVLLKSNFSQPIPIDDDGNNTLTYSATLKNGNPLPTWLNFDPATKTFSGTSAEAVECIIIAKVTDTAGASCSCDFQLTISNPSGIKENKD